MAYLLSQYTLLFLLTAVLAFLLGRWWVQRRYVDITESWESLRAAREQDEGFRDRLWTGLEELRRSVAPTVRTELAALPPATAPELDLSEVLVQLRTLSQKVDAMPKAPRLDLAPLFERLDQLERRVRELPVPEPVDLGGLEGRLDGRFDGRLKELETTLLSLPLPKSTDIGPLLARFEGMEQRFADQMVVAASATATESAPSTALMGADLAPLGERLQRLETAVRDLPRIERQDLQSINFRLGELERSLRQQPDWSGRFSELAQTIAALPGCQATPAPALVAAVFEEPEEPEGPGPELFATPERGEPDDLKQISGIGPKLEALLQQNGVYYFWQVASWEPADIRFIDKRLEVFKGRIARDEWVRQARELMESPSSPSLDLG